MVAVGTVALLLTSWAFAACSLDQNASVPDPGDGDGGVASDTGNDLGIAGDDSGADAIAATMDSAVADTAADTREVDARADTGVDSSFVCTTDCDECPDYSPCGGDNRCFEGECVERCPTHDDGTVPCRTLCGWCKATCLFTWSDEGTGESCNVTDTPAWCYCDFG